MRVTRRMRQEVTQTMFEMALMALAIFLFFYMSQSARGAELSGTPQSIFDLVDK